LVLIGCTTPNDLKLDDVCEVIYNELSFNLDPINNMATIGYQYVTNDFGSVEEKRRF
jgi:hypothetical protein